MATVRQAKHDLLKTKWQEIIAAQRQSGQSIRNWCEENQISAPSFFYWNKIIREDSLIQAGVMAVTESKRFAEITMPNPLSERVSDSSSQVCAVLRVHQTETEIEIHNGADANSFGTCNEVLLSQRFQGFVT